MFMLVHSSCSAQPGLVFQRGSPGAWDDASLGRPVVRCFLRDEGQRWCMWYSGRGAGDPDRDAISPGAGFAGPSAAVFTARARHSDMGTMGHAMWHVTSRHAARDRQEHRMGEAPRSDAHLRTAVAGLAASADGITWQRGAGQVAGRAGLEEVGRVLTPNTEDWWTLDTAHVSVSDVQVRQNPAKPSRRPAQKRACVGCALYGQETLRCGSHASSKSPETVELRRLMEWLRLRSGRRLMCAGRLLLDHGLKCIKI